MACTNLRMFSYGLIFTRETRLIAMVRLAIFSALLSLILADDCPNQKVYVANGQDGAVFCLRDGKFSCIADDGDVKENRNLMRVVEVGPHTLNQLLMNCQSKRTMTSRDKRDSGWYFTSTYKGTRWCGEARKYRPIASVDELETDKCCRTHKKGCANWFEVVPPMTCLSNSICVHSVVTRYHCTCDEEFKECLTNVIKNTADADKDPQSQTKRARDLQAAKAVGDFYFNELKQTCYVDKTIKKKSHTADNSEHIDEATGYEWKQVAPFNP